MSQTTRKEVSRACTKKKNSAYNDTYKDTNPLLFISYITNLGIIALSGRELHVKFSSINRCNNILQSSGSLNAIPISHQIKAI